MQGTFTSLPSDFEEGEIFGYSPSKAKMEILERREQKRIEEREEREETS